MRNATKFCRGRGHLNAIHTSCRLWIDSRNQSRDVWHQTDSISDDRQSPTSKQSIPYCKSFRSSPFLFLNRTFCHSISASVNQCINVSVEQRSVGINGSPDPSIGTLRTQQLVLRLFSRSCAWSEHFDVANLMSSSSLFRCKQLRARR